MALRIGAPASIVFPMALRHSASASRHPAKAPWPADVLPQRLSRTASPLQHLGQHLRCSALAGQLLRRSAPASNKPHQAEKSTPVRLAIWHTWAGFANSQLLRATFQSIYLYTCAHPHCCYLGSAAQTDANLSAHLHRLPTPPPYLRRMRLLAWPGRRYPMGDKAAAWPGNSCRMANDASSGVGNSSAQTVDAHVLREWEGARKRSAAGGMERSGSLCGRGCQSAEAAPLATMGQCRCVEAKANCVWCA